jgi:ABC-type nitrate/sulfonate/bicarbonate transport system substrate-binding protein
MNKQPWRKWSFSLFSLVLAGALLAGCGAGASDKGAEKLKLKIADISTNPVFRVAESKGIFDKHGIDAELITFATPAEGINSLFIKQVDIAFGADFPLLNAVSKGDYSIFASTGTATERSASDWKLFVRDTVASGADLKGKKLSFMRGTFLPYLWDVYLAENGLKLSDAELIGQGGVDEAFVALKKGEVDAVWVYSSFNHEKFQGLSNVHVLSDMSQTSVRLGTGLIATNQLIADHPDQLVDLLKAGASRRDRRFNV